MHLSPYGLGYIRRAPQILNDIIDADRLSRSLKPRRRDHDGQPLDEITQRPIRLALSPNHHGRAEIGKWRTLGAKHECRLMTTAQMLGNALVAKPTEVNDTPHPLTFGHACKVASPSPLTLLEPLPAGHGVNEEVGDVNIPPGPLKTARIGHIPLAQLTPLQAQMLGLRGSPHETADIDT